MGLYVFSVRQTEEFTGIRYSWISFNISMCLNNNKINKWFSTTTGKGN